MFLFWMSTKMQHHSIATLCILLSIAGCSVATNAEPSAATPSSNRAFSLENMVGNWEATQFGRQILTARPDGTATIQMRLTPMAAVVYGRHVTLDLQMEARRKRIDSNDRRWDTCKQCQKAHQKIRQHAMLPCPGMSERLFAGL